MSLLIGSTFNEIYNLYQLYMPKKAAKSLLSHFAIIERSRGYQGLFLELDRLSIKLESILGNRSEAIREANSEGRLLKGHAIWFLRIALRSGRKGGFALARNLLKIQGYFIHAKPTEQDYLDKKAELEGKLDEPFRRFVYPNTDFSVDRVEELLTGTKLSWLTDWANENLTYDFNLPYPSDAKNVQISEKEKLPGYAVTQKDLLRSLWLFPSLVYDEYELFLHIVGPNLPPREKFAGHLAENDIGGSISLLTKDRAMKLRGVSPFTYLLQYVCHPLRMVIKAMLKRHPSSYIEDQGSGVLVGLRKLESGVALSSVDITSASDNISLEAQIRLLSLTLPKGMWRESLIRVFARACRMQLLTPFKGLKMHHVLGSPMGLEGSYDSFSWFLIWIFSEIMPLSAFAMVGDDIMYESRFDGQVKEVFEILGVPISEKKTIWNSTLKGEFCGRFITRYGLLDTYKAKHIDQDNPMPALLRYGKPVLGLFPGLSSQDRSLLASLPLLEKKFHSLDPFRITYYDYVVEQGGYTPTQLFRMKVLSNKQYYVLRYLVALMYSDSKISSQEFARMTLRRKVKDSKTKTMVSYDIKVSEQIQLGEPLSEILLNTGRKTLNGRYKPSSLKELYVQWIAMLHLEVEDHILIKPGYTPPDMVLFASLITELQQMDKDKGIPFTYKPDVKLWQGDERAINNHSLTLAKVMLSEKERQQSPGSQVNIDRSLIDRSPLEQDIAKGKQFLSGIKNTVKQVFESATNIFSFYGFSLLRALFRGSRKP